MTAARPRDTKAARAPGHDLVIGGLRFASELIAWVAIAWAIGPHSIVLAIIVISILIAIPAVFSTPGDRPGGDGPIAAPGIVTILHLVVQLAAAVVASWLVWPWWIAVAVTVLCLVVIVTEQPRWRSLTRGNTVAASPTIAP